MGNYALRQAYRCRLEFVMNLSIGGFGSVGVISAAELFLQIPFEHANQPGNWFGGLQSCGAVAGYQRTTPKAIPPWFDGPADYTRNMQMPQIALRLPQLVHAGW